MSTADPVRELRRLGFSSWETGGGCRCMGLTLKSGRYLMVTNDDAMLPRAGEECVIGLYAADVGGAIGAEAPIDQEQCPPESVIECLRALLQKNDEVLP